MHTVDRPGAIVLDEQPQRTDVVERRARAPAGTSAVRCPDREGPGATYPMATVTLEIEQGCCAAINTVVVLGEDRLPRDRPRRPPISGRRVGTLVAVEAKHSALRYRHDVLPLSRYAGRGAIIGLRRSTDHDLKHDASLGPAA